MVFSNNGNGIWHIALSGLSTAFSFSVSKLDFCVKTTGASHFTRLSVFAQFFRFSDSKRIVHFSTAEKKCPHASATSQSGHFCGSQECFCHFRKEDNGMKMMTQKRTNYINAVFLARK